MHFTYLCAEGELFLLGDPGSAQTGGILGKLGYQVWQQLDNQNFTAHVKQISLEQKIVVQ